MDETSRLFGSFLKIDHGQVGLDCTDSVLALGLVPYLITFYNKQQNNLKQD